MSAGPTSVYKPHFHASFDGLQQGMHVPYESSGMTRTQPRQLLGLAPSFKCSGQTRNRPRAQNHKANPGGIPQGCQTLDRRPRVCSHLPCRASVPDSCSAACNPRLRVLLCGAGPGRLAEVKSAADYLVTRRTYTGLETPFTGAAAKPVVIAVAGRSGRAAQYEDEPSASNVK